MVWGSPGGGHQEHVQPSAHCAPQVGPQGFYCCREASDKEKAKDLPTFKDNGFLKKGQKLPMGEESKKNFLETLK